MKLIAFELLLMITLPIYASSAILDARRNRSIQRNNTKTAVPFVEFESRQLPGTIQNIFHQLTKKVSCIENNISTYSDTRWRYVNFRKGINLLPYSQYTLFSPKNRLTGLRTTWCRAPAKCTRVSCGIWGANIEWQCRTQPLKKNVPAEVTENCVPMSRLLILTQIDIRHIYLFLAVAVVGSLKGRIIL